MQRVSRDNCNFWFDRKVAPVLAIEPGEELLLETYASRRACVEGPNGPLPVRCQEGSNPATGPIYVRGAEPGDRLLVTLLDIRTQEYGYCAVTKGWGVLEHLVQPPYDRVVRVRDGEVMFTENIRFPWRPMVGVVGCAPAEGRVATAVPHDIGSNMDDNQLAPGATVHLPVHVTGALFGLGDVHASMGDGEMSGGGIEICAEVQIRIELRKKAPLPRPIVVAEDLISTYGWAAAIADALRIASEDMHRLIVVGLRINAGEAFILMSIRADMGVCQCCGGGIPATARCDFPRLFEP